MDCSLINFQPTKQILNCIISRDGIWGIYWRYDKARWNERSRDISLSPGSYDSLMNGNLMMHCIKGYQFHHPLIVLELSFAERDVFFNSKKDC